MPEPRSDAVQFRSSLSHEAAAGRRSAERASRLEFVGDSRSILQLRAMALTVAPKGATLFLNGESGTGKEVLARFIYAHSARSHRPFVAINCAALPESLVESELFGHEKGAFTGATHSKPGCFEEAHTGTLFLDEVTEIRPHIQAKLLRVIQEREVRRVGGTRDQKVDVRVIAASSRDLQACLRDGSLRPDLYYRLSMVEMHVPPLRERREDIRALTGFFLRKHGPPNASPLTEVSDEVVALFHRYAWPGNVRELENVVARATVLAPHEDGHVLLVRHLPARLCEEAGAAGRGAPPLTFPFPPVPADAAPGADLELDFRAALLNLKRQYAQVALQRTRGNKAEAARLLGISRRCLYNFLEPALEANQSW